MDIPTTLTRNDAQRFLLKAGFTDGTLPYPQLRQALAIVAEHCDYQIFGVCAGDGVAAIRALHAYTDALGYDRPPELAPIAEAAYIKYNPKTDLCYINPYEGNERGVLVSCQSVYDTGIRDIYGHLPLDLFDDLPDAT
ncbi:MAG: DUF1824 family protein [Geitlerinemataceae cyanobacterium]